MPSKKRVVRKKPDHRFKAIYDKDVKWEEGAANELLTLPTGLRVKIFVYDPVMKRIDLKVKFPQEPALHSRDQGTDVRGR
jgi:hypothetical protein